MSESVGDEDPFSYVPVITVYNMRNRAFGIEDDGGVFGNEAGSLGAGSCNVMLGPGGLLWLGLPDRRLLADVDLVVRPERSGNRLAILANSNITYR